MEYNMQIAAAGGSEIAKILGTEVLDNSEKNLTKCAFANIRLPLEIGEQEGQIPSSKTGLVTPWIRREADQKFDTYFLCFLYGGSYWWRVSGQIYLELDDFIRGGNIMKELCDQVRKGEVW